MATYEKITFRPISGGFRCNQTGEKVSRGKTESYKRDKLNSGKTWKKHKTRLTILAKSTDRNVLCPSCGRGVAAEAGKVTCECGQRLKVKIQKVKTDSWDDSSYWRGYSAPSYYGGLY